MGTSDVIAQTFIDRKKVKEIELPRVAKFIFLGTCFVVSKLYSVVYFITTFILCSCSYIVMDTSDISRLPHMA